MNRPAAVTTPRTQPASRTPLRLVPRKVRFDWSQTPRDWIPGQPFTSHFINEINLLLPAGEFWFCKLYSRALPFISDPRLRDDVQMFIRQEAMHARAHGGAIQQFLNAHGLETASQTDRGDRLFNLLLGDAPLGLNLPEAARKEWLSLRLGLVAAIEHVTCILGTWVLGPVSWPGADPAMFDLLRWHGAEEVEHRCVAFDVYRHLAGRFPSRYVLGPLAMPAVIAMWAVGAAHLMRQDPRFKTRKPSVLRPWIWREWMKDARAGRLPSPFWVARRNLSFFSPWYDPVKEGSTEQALDYLARSPAARAAAA
ncbi:MAG: metal-dependent hydrolase [Panacagrimonas sp.]